MRRWLAISVVFTLALFGGSLAHAYRGTVTIALPGEPPTMDPHVTSNFVGTIVWFWAYDGLIRSETGTGKLVPWLATKWEQLSPTKVKFWLRKGVKFSDGTPVTSEAVKYTMKRVLASARQRPYFQAFDHIEILDDHTFIWHSKVPDLALFHRLSRWVGLISPKTEGMDQATISRHTFGAGPYILESWTKGAKMVFKANPNWWANDRFPNRPETVILRRIVESTTRVKSLLAGEVDVIMGVLPHFIPEIKANPNTEVAAKPAVRLLFVSMNTRYGGPFADRNVRLAVNYAIDADQICKTIVGGFCDSFGSLYHPWNFVGYNPNDKWYGYDLKKAKKYLKTSAYPNGFKATLYATVGRYPGDKQSCEAIAGMLTKIGIRTTCRANNFPLYRKIYNSYQMGKRKGAAMFQQAFGNGGGEPALISRSVLSCKGTWSQHCFKELDALIEKAAAETDLDRAQAAYEKVTAKSKELATHKMLYKIHDVFGYQKRLKFYPRHDETLFAWEIEVLK